MIHFAVLCVYIFHYKFIVLKTIGEAHKLSNAKQSEAKQNGKK